jgi:acyl-CoA thioester hydrolase
MNAYKLEFEVRDNEIDAQGIVNNTNYPIYFMHTRHKFLKDHGISFSEMTDAKQYLLLTSSYTEFKSPLRSEDKFYVTCSIRLEGKIRMAFDQEIRRIPDDVLISKSINIGVCVDGNNRNKPYVPEIFTRLLQMQGNICD